MHTHLDTSRIYYEDKELFQRQECVCDIVRSLEDYWRVPSSSFNILPAYKGMFAGPIGYAIKRLPRVSAEGYDGDEEEDADDDDDDHIAKYGRSSHVTFTWGVNWVNRTEFVYKQELSVDPSQIENLVTKGDISWVLVVEKETVFTERVQELNQIRVSNNANLNGRGVGVLVTVRLPTEKSTRICDLMGLLFVLLPIREKECQTMQLVVCLS